MIKRIATVAATMALAAGGLLADGFNPKFVPADAKWVVHVDADAVAASPFWDIIQARLDANPQAQAKLQEMEMVTGVVFPQDLHAITLFGLGTEEADNIILIKAKFNQEQLLQMFQGNPGYSSTNHGNHQIISWDDKGKVNYGGFFGADYALIGQNKDNVAKAFDMLDGKGEAIKADSFMAAPAGSAVLACLASDSVQTIAQKEKNNPVLKQIKAAWVSLSEKDKSVTLKGHFGFPDAQVAQQMKAMAEGVKAAGMVFANNEKTDPNIKALLPLLPGLTITSQDTWVELNWIAPFDQVKSVVQQIEANKQKAAGAK